MTDVSRTCTEAIFSLNMVKINRFSIAAFLKLKLG